MKTPIKLLLALTAMAALTASVQADTLYGAIRDGTAVRVPAGLISHNPPAGTTDGLRYAPRLQTGSLDQISHRAPAGTTDLARQLAGRRSPAAALGNVRTLSWVEQPR